MVGTLERVDRFVTAALAVVFLVGGDFLAGMGRIGNTAPGSLSGMSLVPERVVRGLVAALMVVVFLMMVFAVALGADGGLTVRTGRGILDDCYVML